MTEKLLGCRRFLLFCLFLVVTVKITVAAGSDVEPTAYLPLLLTSQSDIPEEQNEGERLTTQKINEQRESNSLPDLKLVPELTQAARRHSKDMADNHFTGHTGSDGSTSGQRILEAGYDRIYWGEIIGWGFGGDTDQMVAWWMNSPVHKSLILSSTYEDFGAGYIQDVGSDWGHYWTVNFGLRNSSNDHTVSAAMYHCSYSMVHESGGTVLSVYSKDPCP